MSCLEKNFKIPPNFEAKDLFTLQQNKTFCEQQSNTNRQKRILKAEKRKAFALKII